MHRSSFAFLSLLSAVLSLPNVAFAQKQSLTELHQYLEKTPQPILASFEQWNHAKKIPSKGQFELVIKGDFDRLAKEQSAQWLEPRDKLWNELPETLNAEMSIAPGAQLVLIGLLDENSQALEKMIPEAPDRQRHLDAKFYFVFGVSQAIARERGSLRIEASHVFAATQRGSYAFWPFYCPPPPPKK